MKADQIKSIVKTWGENATDLSQVELYESFIKTFTKKNVLDIIDYFVDNISEQQIEAYNNGGAVYATISWMLPIQGFRNTLVDKIATHYGFDHTTVSPRCALRKALCARIHLRKADNELSKIWPINVDLINAIVCKLNDEQDVYDLYTDFLDTVLDN